MNAIEHLEEYRWERPAYYGGFSPDGDYCIYSHTRDSEILERSNYRSIWATLKDVADRYKRDLRDEPYVYELYRSHFLVGWIEYIIVRSDAPDEILETAANIVCALADYPIWDEHDFSLLEMEERDDTWEFVIGGYFLDQLLGTFQDDIDDIDNILEDVRSDYPCEFRKFFDGMAERAREYWEREGDSVSIDAHGVGRAVTIDDIKALLDSLEIQYTVTA